MPFVANVDSHRALFATHFWRNKADERGSESTYTTIGEAQAEFERVEAAGQFQFGGLYEWSHAADEWQCLDAFPETFDGFEWD